MPAYGQKHRSSLGSIQRNEAQMAERLPAPAGGLTESPQRKASAESLKVQVRQLRIAPTALPKNKEKIFPRYVLSVTA